MNNPQSDPNAGVGGSYVINPETGERELEARTQDAPRPDAIPETAPQAAEPAEE